MRTPQSISQPQTSPPIIITNHHHSSRMKKNITLFNILKKNIAEIKNKYGGAREIWRCKRKCMKV